MKSLTEFHAPESDDPTFAVVGSRNFPDLTKVDRVIDYIASKYPKALIRSGGAIGVDARAVERADFRGLRTDVIRPQPKPGQSYAEACLARNFDIVKDVDIVIVFMTEPFTQGTHDAREKARMLGKHIVDYRDHTL